VGVSGTVYLFLEIFATMVDGKIPLSFLFTMDGEGNTHTHTWVYKIHSRYVSPNKLIKLQDNKKISTIK
jgi:hypothetical protein